VDSPLEPPDGTQPLGQLNFRFLTSRYAIDKSILW